jgi:hypothetical protein
LEPSNWPLPLPGACDVDELFAFSLRDEAAVIGAVGLWNPTGCRSDPALKYLPVARLMWRDSACRRGDVDRDAAADDCER